MESGIKQISAPLEWISYPPEIDLADNRTREYLFMDMDSFQIYIRIHSYPLREADNRRIFVH